MPEKDPSSYPLATYAWVLGLAIWGGIVRHYQHLQQTKKPFKFWVFMGELSASGLTGILVFFGGESSNTEQMLTFMMVGIAGHAGAETLLFMRDIIMSRFTGKPLGRKGGGNV